MGQRQDFRGPAESAQSPAIPFLSELSCPYAVCAVSLDGEGCGGWAALARGFFVGAVGSFEGLAALLSGAGELGALSSRVCPESLSWASSLQGSSTFLEESNNLNGCSAWNVSFS